MNNEEKILSMLDLIASELKGLKETSVTKDEFRSFNEQVNDRFNKVEENMAIIEQQMVTKDDFHATLEALNTKIDSQSELFEGRFDVLNDRLFNQETQIRILKKKEAL